MNLLLCAPRRSRFKPFALCVTSKVAAAAVLIASLAASSKSQALELISDGGFENDAQGWDSDTTGDGDWFLDSVGQLTALSLMPTSDQGGGQGSYVVSDQLGPTFISLFQDFTVPRGGTSVVLSYDMFVNDWSNQTSFNPQQHARVDLVSPDTPHFETESGVILNTYLGTDGGPRPNVFVHYEFDITPFVFSGGDFQIRFLTVDSFNTINQGVDNVSVQFVPEPTALALGISGGIFVPILIWFRGYAARKSHLRASGHSPTLGYW